MAIIPPKLSSAQIDSTGRYRCPLCRSQSAGDPVDIGWAQCPMLDDLAICLGCCVDYQAVARSDDFDEHPFQSLFDDLARTAGQTRDELRRRCLEHQASIVQRIPDHAPDDEDARAIVRALAAMQSR